MFGCLFRLILLVALALLAFLLLTSSVIQHAGSSVLSAFNSSAASGFAEFIPANLNDKNNHLQVSASGLSPKGSYYITLDSGSCGGSQIQDLGPATADSSGDINKTFTLGQIDTSQTWYVDIHQGNDPAGLTLACGQLIINSNNAGGTKPIISLSPDSNDTGQVNAPTIAGGSTSTTNIQPGFPNTGVKPGNKNTYDNNVYPRKF
jgi:hypothetical protein